MTSIAHESAKRHVEFYVEQSERVTEDHRAAMDCRDCEDLLQLGIDAYSWLCRAEDALRCDIYVGNRKNDPIVSISLDALYTLWRKPVEVAEKWISKTIEAGYIPDNLKEFRKACEDVEDICERRAWSNLSELSRQSLAEDDAW